MEDPNRNSSAGCRSAPRLNGTGGETTRRACRSTPFDGADEKHTGGILALEPHYAPNELANLWGMSGKVIRSIFLNEAGVLKIDRPEQRNKRGYCSLRIPQSTAIRVHRRLSRPRGWPPLPSCPTPRSSSTREPPASLEPRERNTSL